MLETLRPLADEVAKAENVPVDLLLAIVQHETAGNTWAVRYEPNWKYWCDPQTYATKNGITYSTERQLQSCSWGLGQVMGAVARELGLTGPIPSLCEPGTGLTYCAKKLRQLMDKYPACEDDAISAYNQGNAMKDQRRQYLNFSYVDAVNAFRVQFKNQVV